MWDIRKMSGSQSKLMPGVPNFAATCLPLSLLLSKFDRQIKSGYAIGHGGWKRKLLSIRDSIQHAHADSVDGHARHVVKLRRPDALHPPSRQLQRDADDRTMLLESCCKSTLLVYNCLDSVSMLSGLFGSTTWVTSAFTNIECILPTLGLLHQPVVFLAEGGAHNEEWQTKDDRAVQHGKGSHQLPLVSDGNLVAIAHRCNGDNGPPESTWN
mmetsp:Transcript_5504/g.9088  ORF Transcript_5504/g.9088 Transcript_5504/m.9088 type:complete len:212 (-) Transcript_5504:126-761(-)